MMLDRSSRRRTIRVPSPIIGSPGRGRRSGAASGRRLLAVTTAAHPSVAGGPAVGRRRRLCPAKRTSYDVLLLLLLSLRARLPLLWRRDRRAKGRERRFVAEISFFRAFGRRYAITLYSKRVVFAPKLFVVVRDISRFRYGFFFVPRRPSKCRLRSFASIINVRITVLSR